MPRCPSAGPGAGMCTICAQHKREVRLKGFTKVYNICTGTDPTILKVKATYYLFLYAPTVIHHISYQRQDINVKFFLYCGSGSFL